MSKKQRFMWLFLTALFIFTGVLLSVWAFWVNSHPANSNQNNTTNSQKEANTNKLQGTKLANFTPLAKIDTLQKVDTTTGSGKEVSPNSTITFDYTGAVAATGIIFQSSKDSGQAATYPLNQLIKGWQQGIPGMKVGGTRRLLIPASLAYGSSPPPGSGIPANADLVFDITVISAN